jgi:DNA helicase-2/ATP-dependent DNA helicase PcrA
MRTQMTTFEEIKFHISNDSSFVLEAGAGSGKTYALIQTLNHLIETKGKKLQFYRQRIICITYTNVAKNEIIERLEHNPLVIVSTIHEFLWECISSYQKQLKVELCKLNEIRYAEELAKKAGLTGARLLNFEHRYHPNLEARISNIESVIYQDTAFRDFEQGLLHHDDIITLSRMMFEMNPLLTTIIAQKHPYILVDEYQDTSEDTTTSLIEYLLLRNMKKVILGFYGDSHQKIYEVGVGDLEKYYTKEDGEENTLQLVKKEENYRSSKEVVRLLNQFRTNIQQHPIKEINGSVKFIFCKNYPSRELKGTNGRNKDEGTLEYEKRLEPQKNINYENVFAHLVQNGWDFSEAGDDKILVIANSRVAKRAGFGNLYQVFNNRYNQRTKEQLLDRNHSLIKHFLGYIDKKTSQERETGVEHLVSFWEAKNYNEIFRFLKRNSDFFNGVVLKHSHKKVIGDVLTELIDMRNTRTIKDVFNFLEQNNVIRKSDSLNRFIERISVDISTLTGKDLEKAEKDLELFNSFLQLPYLEIMNFFKHVQNNTVFSTKHGTKGEEYRNVLTVIDDVEWKQEYNFQNFFNNTEDNDKRKLNTRNLFYVECSRAKENLVVLSLSEMDGTALNTLSNWFGRDNVINIEDL